MWRVTGGPSITYEIKGWLYHPAPTRAALWRWLEGPWGKENFPSLYLIACIALTNSAIVNTETLIDCFKRYLSQGGKTVTREQFDRNLLEKAHSREFREDITPLLNPISSRDFAFDDALDLVRDQLIAMLPGRPWKGVGR